MNRIDEVLTEVMNSRYDENNITQSKWRKPKLYCGYLILDSQRNPHGNYSVRVDAIEDSARIYVVGDGLPAAHKVPCIRVAIDSKLINDAISQIIENIESELIKLKSQAAH